MTKPKVVLTKSYAKDEPPLVAVTDWRLQASTWMTQPATINGHEYPVGTLVKLMGNAKVSRDTVVSGFGVPNVTALLLDHAARLEILVQDFLPTALPANAAHHNDFDFNLFELFEAKMASVVFSHTALEAFANEIISRAYASKYRYEPRKKVGISVSYELSTIERTLALEEKIGTIIPEVFQVPSVKGRRQWNQFQRLKRLRDRVIHCKARDRRASNPEDDTLWRALLESAVINFAVVAYELIGYFYEAKPGEMPRWYLNWPYGTQRR